MTDTIWRSIRGRACRFTKVDACGAPVTGARSTLVTKGFITVSYKFNIQEGKDTTVLNADGQIEVADQTDPALKWVDLELQFSRIDPDALNLVTTQPLVTDHAASSVGVRIKEKLVAATTGFALEVWTDVPGGDACADGLSSYGYFLAPFIVQGRIDDFDISDDALNMKIKARTKKGSLWDVGPYDVDAADVDNTPGPLLTAIGATDHLDLHLTTIAPPAETAGAVALA